ncbi:MAG: hypothetical protein ACQEVA_02420 [Myxococcota bacterium]
MSESTKQPGRFRLEIQQGAHVMRAGLGPGGGPLVSYEIWRHLQVDAGFRYGGIFPLFGDFDRQFYLGGIAGLALTTGAAPEGWEFRLGGRYARLHHAPWASWAQTPFANFVGAGGATGAHGAEVVVGATKTAGQGFEFGDMLFSMSARAGYFPNSVEVNWIAGVVLAAGFRLYRK